jgi:hypothetical protein
VHYHVPQLTVDGQIGQHDIGDGIVIPIVAGSGLVMPNVLAGRAADGDDAVRAKVVALAAVV